MPHPRPRTGLGAAAALTLGAALLAGLTWGHLTRLQAFGPLAKAVQDALHLPAFALTTVVALRLASTFRPSWPPAVRAGAAFAAVAALGGALESSQRLVGRGASLGDLVNDLTGAAAALALWGALAWRRPDGAALPWFVRTAVALACLGALGVRTLPVAVNLQARAARESWLPVIVDADTPLSRNFVFEQGADTAFTPPPAAWPAAGRLSVMRVGFRASDFSAFGLHGFHPDWSGAAGLGFSYALEGAGPLALKAIVEDNRSGGGGVRFGRAEFRLTLEPGAGRIVLPLGPDTPLYRDRIVRVRLAATRERVAYFGDFTLEAPAAPEPQRTRP